VLAKGAEALRRAGFNPILLPHAGQSYRGYLAAPDADRLADLVHALTSPEFDAVLLARGGYGCTRLLPYLPWEQLATLPPKLVMGFSDATALLVALHHKLGWAGLYSPMLTSNLAPNPQASPQASQATWEAWLQWLKPASPPNLTIANHDPYTCLRSGQAHGSVMVGNLTLLAALCGTPWQPDLTGYILVIEDWKERYYSLDRQWVQLDQAGLLNGIAGLLLADFSFCDTEAESFGYSLAEQWAWLTQGLNVPVGYGFSVGHGQLTASLPIGLTANFDANAGTLTYTQPLWLT
jgi:muramoyltetrapeptide carboxypeptidase